MICGILWFREVIAFSINSKTYTAIINTLSAGHSWEKGEPLSLSYNTCPNSLLILIKIWSNIAIVKSPTIVNSFDKYFWKTKVHQTQIYIKYFFLNKMYELWYIASIRQCRTYILLFTYQCFLIATVSFTESNPIFRSPHYGV